MKLDLNYNFNTTNSSELNPPSKCLLQYSGTALRSIYSISCNLVGCFLSVYYHFYGNFFILQWPSPLIQQCRIVLFHQYQNHYIYDDSTVVWDEITDSTWSYGTICHCGHYQIQCIAAYIRRFEHRILKWPAKIISLLQISHQDSWCVVDNGILSKWTDWLCIDTCGNTTQVRNRTCDPDPDFDQDVDDCPPECDEPLTESEECDAGCCKREYKLYKIFL